MSSEDSLTRREFVASTAKAAAGAVLLNQMPGIAASKSMATKRRLSMVGTGHRGTGMWGTSVLKDYGDLVEFVGLCDINPGRAETAKKMLSSVRIGRVNTPAMIGDQALSTSMVII